METIIAGTDTLFSFITAGEFGQSNGFSFTQSPDSLVGFYKSNVMPGDTAIFLVNFSTLGVSIYDSVFNFVGTQSTWSRFAFALNFGQTPDSCFIAVASSNALNGVGIQHGSWLMLDDIGFAGTGITQTIPNSNFELWTIDTLNSLNDWEYSDAIIQTTDNVEGNFALKTETVEIDGDTAYVVTNGRISNSGIVGGQPFVISNDTLIGYYKYVPAGNDTAAMSLNFVKNGGIINQTFKIFTTQPTYTSFEVPFNVSQTPDSLFIIIASSALQNKTIGSALYMDDLKLKSIVTSLDEEIEAFGEIELDPNPTTDNITVSFHQQSENTNLQIIDQLGRLYTQVVVAAGRRSQEIDVSNLKSGVYFLRITKDEKVIHRQFVKN